MKGIDVSRWNGWPFDAATADGYKDADFVVVKATQGVSYSYLTYFAKAMAKANADKKLLGAYHYAAGGNPEAEADYFISVVKPYIGTAVLALDWEAGGNRAWGSKTWARKFVDRVHKKTGVWCLIYTGVEGVKHCASCATDCLLWFAGYPDNRRSWVIPAWPSRYKIAPWKHWSIWQYTSGGATLDRNISGLTTKQWKELAGAKTKPTPKPAPKPAETPKPAKKTKQPYSGTLPTLPARGYYKFGDGWKTLTTKKTQFKRVQKLVNWLVDEKLVVDGLYGAYTELGVKAAQKMLGVESDGKFGKNTLAASKLYKK